MIAALPVKNMTVNSELSERFARSDCFAIIDKTEQTLKFVENPYRSDKTGVGKNILNFLSQNYQIDTIIGFELGLKVHQMANEMMLNIVIINEANRTLKSVFQTMSVSPRIL